MILPTLDPRRGVCKLYSLSLYHPFFFLLIQATGCFNMLSDSGGYVNSLLVPWPHAWWWLTVFDTVEWHLTHSDNVNYLLLGTKSRQKWQPHSFQRQQRRLLLQHLLQVLHFQGNTERKTIYSLTWISFENSNTHVTAGCVYPEMLQQEKQLTAVGYKHTSFEHLLVCILLQSEGSLA